MKYIIKNELICLLETIIEYSIASNKRRGKAIIIRYFFPKVK